MTFKECVAANDCSMNRDEWEGFFFAKKIRAASLNCLNRGSSLVRDALVTSTVCDVIDEDEFVHLFYVYSPLSSFWTLHK